MTDIAVLMTRDHDRLDAIFADFRRSSNIKTAQLFSEFESGLRAHMAWEEEMIFPSVEARSGAEDSGPTALMRAEHERIKELLQVIREQIDRGCERRYLQVPETGSVQTVFIDNIDRAVMKASVRKLTDVLVPHKQKEKGSLYHSLERILTEGERVDLIGRIQSPPPDAQDRH